MQYRIPCPLWIVNLFFCFKKSLVSAARPRYSIGAHETPNNPSRHRARNTFLCTVGVAGMKSAMEFFRALAFGLLWSIVLLGFFIAWLACRDRV